MSVRKTYSSSLAILLKDICKVPSALDTHISGLAIDSRLVKKGDLFLALSGSHTNSTDHIKEAIARGANAVVAEGAVNKGRVFENGIVVELFVDNLKQKLGVIADRFFRSPSAEISVVGVTGTNGKTSVTNYLASYFSQSGQLSGVIGTLGYGIVGSEDVELRETGFTTPNVVDVHRCLAELRDLGAKNVFMEVSSHGLNQGRVDGVRFEGAVFTNLTREHLDYHGTMQNYAESKQKLFAKEGLKFAVINQDDEYASEFIRATSKNAEVLTYGIKHKGSVSVLSCKLDPQGDSTINALIKLPANEVSISSNLIGLFNLSNLLAVLTVALAKGNIYKCEEKIKAIKPVNGRMQCVQVTKKPLVIVDYAHTPDALKNVLEAARPHCKGNLSVVFGCGGDRDTGKRPEMARVSELLADRVIVTDDNPRTERAEIITAQIFEGFHDKHKVLLEHDRAKAIAIAIKEADVNDVVLVAGKGHETWQEVNGKRFQFSDLEEVKKVLGVQTQNNKNCEAVN